MNGAKPLRFRALRLRARARSEKDSTGRTLRPTALRTNGGIRIGDRWRKECSIPSRAREEVRMARDYVGGAESANFDRKGEQHVKGVTARRDEGSLYPSADEAAGRGSSSPETAWRRQQEASLSTAGGIGGVTPANAVAHPRLSGLQ